jgi:plastocyanin
MNLVTLDSRRGSRLVMTVVLLSLVCLAALPLAFGVAPARAATTWNVSMYGEEMEQIYEFRPANLTINVGDTVNWTSTAMTHTTTADPGQAEWWDSGAVPVGQSYAHTFTIPGTYTYHSGVDPNMHGTIVVQQPTPEFPGFVALTTVALAVFLGLLLERKLRN